MIQQLRYGLATPLRALSLPDSWKNECTVTCTNAISEGKVVAAEVHELIASQQSENQFAFTIKESGVVRLDRNLSGNTKHHITLHVPNNTQVIIYDTITGSGILSGSVSMQIGRNSTVQYFAQSVATDDSIVLLDYQADVSHSELNWTVAALSGAQTQVGVLTRAGERSVVNTTTVLCGTNQQQFDMHAAVRHVGPHSKSDILTRGVLDGSARAIVHGLITITDNAGESDSYQKAELLLLGDNASADAIPNLEIHNHNVRCSHGATIGKLDSEQLFYARSRGISEVEAKRIITEGFIAPHVPREWMPRVRAILGFQTE